MPFDGKELFWHYHMVRFKALGPMGAWVTMVSDGSTELAQQACIKRKPFWGDDPCKCGWQSNVLKLEV